METNKLIEQQRVVGLGSSGDVRVAHRVPIAVVLVSLIKIGYQLYIPNFYLQANTVKFLSPHGNQTRNLLYTKRGHFPLDQPIGNTIYQNRKKGNLKGGNVHY